MQFTTLFVTLLATAVAASPVSPISRTDKPYDACDGLFDSLQCCATDVLGVADLDCSTPSTVPTSPASFASICAAGGQRARCCVLPVLGQSVLCQTPLGL